MDTSVQQKRRWFCLEYFEQEINTWDVGLGCSHTFPLSLDKLSVRVAVEQNIPKKFIALLVQALPNDLEIGAELNGF